jgi:hypothetical protein
MHFKGPHFAPSMILFYVQQDRPHEVSYRNLYEPMVKVGQTRTRALSTDEHRFMRLSWIADFVRSLSIAKSIVMGGPD